MLFNSSSTDFTLFKFGNLMLLIDYKFWKLKEKWFEKIMHG